MTTEESRTIEGLEILKCKSDSYAHVLAEEMARLLEGRIDPNQTLAVAKITFWSHGEEIEFEFDVIKDDRTEVTDGVAEVVTEYSREVVRINRRRLPVGSIPPPPAPAVTRARVTDAVDTAR